MGDGRRLGPSIFGRQVSGAQSEPASVDRQPHAHGDIGGHSPSGRQAQAADAGSGQADGDDAARVPAGAAGAQGSTTRRFAVSGGRARSTPGRPLLYTRCQTARFNAPDHHRRGIGQLCSDDRQYGDRRGPQHALAAPAKSAAAKQPAPPTLPQPAPPAATPPPTTFHDGVATTVPPPPAAAPTATTATGATATTVP